MKPAKQSTEHSKPEPLAYLIVGLLCYVLAGVMAWSSSAFSPDYQSTLHIFIVIFTILGTLGILLAAVSRYLSRSKS